LQAVYALVVNGDVLAHVLKAVNDPKDNLNRKFLEIGTNCRSVICSRSTPLQKALVVRLVKKNQPTAITLAIGDGANDVSMIQEAHIGVGIMGKEGIFYLKRGTQAVRAADYAFGEFKFLQRLLSVHGRYNLLRLSNVILYSFYKNFVFILIQFLFGFVNNWSGQLVYEELFFTAFNVVFTSFPPLMYAIFEKDLEDKDIDAHPELYIEVREGLFWSRSKLLFWFMISVLHSVAIFLSVYFTNYEGAADSLGYSTGYWVQCYMFSTPMLLTVTSKLIINTRFWIYLTVILILLSILASVILMFLLLVLTSLYYIDYDTASIAHAMPSYYLLSILMPAACIVPDLLFWQ
jgi:phospholipid-transporting ATPase